MDDCHRMCLLLALLVPCTAVHARQFVFVDDTITWTKNSYDEPPQLGPTNWTSPVDYVNGRVLARYHVLSKPSTKTVAVQLCMWQDNYALESCSQCYTYTSPGVYYYNWGVPSAWWKKAPLDYTRQFQRIYLMHKDGECAAPLLMTSACGAACYTGTDIDQHVPIRFHVKVIVVAAGDTFVAPADWDCPWAQCAAVENTPRHSARTTVAPATSASSRLYDIRGRLVRGAAHELADGVLVSGTLLKR